jgi:hypothetical protein
MNTLFIFQQAWRLKSRRFLIPGVVVLMLATLLGACGNYKPGGMANCSPDEMSAPLLIGPGQAIEPWTPSPDDYSISPNPPLFQWFHQGSCVPTDYRVIISRIPAMPYGDLEYAGSLVMDVTTTGSDSAGPTIIYEDGSTAVPHTWSPGETLNPGTYYWRVIPYSRSVRGEYSDWMIFRVGRPCSRDDGLPTPRLISPRDGQTIVAGRVRFMWLDDNPCVINGSYYLEYSQYSYFPEGDTYGDLSSNGRIWPSALVYLPSCKQYFWRVRVGFFSERPSTSSEVFSFNTTKPDGTSCFPEPPAPPASSPVPPTVSPPAIMLTPMVTIREPTNCRSGPTTEYPVLDILAAGAQLPIQGKNQAGDSWLVEDPIIGKNCWVSGAWVDVIGDPSLVQIINPDPPTITLPTATSVPPYNCAQFNANTCQINNHPCIWNGIVCVNK